MSFFNHNKKNVTKAKRNDCNVKPPKKIYIKICSLIKKNQRNL